jgi:endonuclease III
VLQPSHLFDTVIDRLKSRYGRQELPKSDPFELVLWENVAYLLSDERRDAAFEALRRRVGLTPKQILAAPDATLLEIAKMGGMEHLRTIASYALDEFQGDLWKSVKVPLKQAKKALRLFSWIGELGAEKILVFSKTYPVLGLALNGLRVLRRARTQELLSQPPTAPCMMPWRARPGLRPSDHSQPALRRHGKERCKANVPLCRVCPLTDLCAYYKGQDL